MAENSRSSPLTTDGNCSTSPKDVAIREARRNDCDGIASLIKELATFERMADQVEMTAEILARDGFDASPPLFYCLVAVETDGGSGRESDHGRLVGYALYFYTYSTWVGKSMHLEDLYVTPAQRGRGVGSRMLREVAAIARGGGCARLQWNVLAWNSKAIQIYRNLGAIDLTSAEEWHLYRLAEPAISSLADGIAMQSPPSTLPSTT